MLGFQHEHWMKVYKERRRLNLPTFEDVVDDKYPDHELIGKLVFMKDDERIYTVDYVFVSWYEGFHLNVALVDDNNSHSIRILDIGTCNVDFMVDQYNDFYENCLLIVEPEMEFSVYNPYISVNF